MHVIAVAASVARLLVVLSATSHAEVGDGGELAVEDLARVVPSVERRQCRFRVLFPVVLRIHIAHEMVADVVTDVEAFEFAELAELSEYLLEEVFKVSDRFLQRLLRYLGA